MSRRDIPPQIKLDRNIPMPLDRDRRRWEVLRTMSVGDSFELPAADTQRVRMAISQTVKRGLKAKFTTRTQGDKLRVWRVK